MPDNYLDTELSSSVTIAKYERMKEMDNEASKHAIADLIYDRFYQRYLMPFEDNEKTHGFSMMAVGCLMIETLSSFQQGWCDTTGKGKCAFQKFFSNSIYLYAFDDMSVNFYDNIRCGILHQAETKGGWKIQRRGVLLDKEKKIINATKFLDALHNELRFYVVSIKNGSFDSIRCRYAIKKLEFICENCCKEKKSC